MSRIGIAKFGNDSGSVEIPIYEPGDFNRDYLRIGTPSGVGVLPLDDVQFSKYDYLRIHTAQGTVSISNKSPGTMEDFESGGLENWHISTDAPTKVTNNAAIIENFGLATAGEESQSTYAQRAYSHPAGNMQPLGVYPEYGTRFECFVRFTQSASEGHHRIGFGVSNQNTNNYFGPITSDHATDFDDWRALDIQASISEIHVWKKVDGNRSQMASGSFNPVADTPYRIRFDWGYTAENTVTIEVFEYNPNGSDAKIVTLSEEHIDMNTSHKGVFLESEFTANPTYWDELRAVR